MLNRLSNWMDWDQFTIGRCPRLYMLRSFRAPLPKTRSSYRGLHPCLGDAAPLGLNCAQHVETSVPPIDFVELTFHN